MVTKTPEIGVPIDQAFFAKSDLAAALKLREQLYDAPYYRLIHAEADGLPAIIVDRIGGVLVAQLNGAGPDGLTDGLWPAHG